MMRKTILTENEKGEQILEPTEHIQGATKAIFRITKQGKFVRYHKTRINYSYVTFNFKVKYPVKLKDGESIDWISYASCGDTVVKEKLEFGNSAMEDLPYMMDSSGSVLVDSNENILLVKEG